MDSVVEETRVFDIVSALSRNVSSDIDGSARAGIPTPIALSQTRIFIFHSLYLAIRKRERGPDLRVNFSCTFRGATNGQDNC